MSDLEPNSKDRLVSVAKGVVGACPLIGSLASEAIGTIIPNQRLDRVVEFLRQLDAEVSILDSRLQNFERNLQTGAGIDVLEEGLLQAARSVAKERKERLARLVGRTLTSEEVKYEESRKLLNLFRDLTDPEILWLFYYSMNPTLGRGPHSELVEKNHGLKTYISSLQTALKKRKADATKDDIISATVLSNHHLRADIESKDKEIKVLKANPLHVITADKRTVIGLIEEHEVEFHRK